MGTGWSPDLVVQCGALSLLLTLAKGVNTKQQAGRWGEGSPLACSCLARGASEPRGAALPLSLNPPALPCQGLVPLSVWASLLPRCSEVTQRAGLGVASSGTWCAPGCGGCRSREAVTVPLPEHLRQELRLVSGRSMMLRMQRSAQAARTTCCRKAPWPMWSAGLGHSAGAPSATMRPRPRPLGETTRH